MILLIHHKSGKITKILNGQTVIDVESKNCVEALWELALKFPEEIIAWCEKEFEEYINFEKWEKETKTV